MARTPTSAESQARRLRAFELYCTVDSRGKRPTFRGIAHQLGVTVTSVNYWNKRDRWQDRVDTQNQETARAIERRQQDVKAALRDGVLDGIFSLKLIAAGGPDVAADDIIKSTLALVKIAKDLNAMDLLDTPNPTARTDLKFDDTTEPDTWDTSTGLISETSPPSLETSPETQLLPLPTSVETTLATSLRPDSPDQVVQLLSTP